ncbi:hypothetical protein [Bittarella massiliensis (ex Durand et al. 2017)]|uniref:Phage portal protein n=1 Tax=Bittarella massiliensis (ex Durand et al. 2017) TaxID=1720313 RepID=A0AAW5KBM8_9FIRM|nr:hypothetical protein [Bittarella massiliensis (ex Durand et al. 2017)]MCQ4950252.1 hypothetical protein [Bittarella massiliensis (ex Durand et al. 2017)]
MERLQEMRRALRRYRDGLEGFHREVLVNEDYFCGNHWKYIKRGQLSGREPKTPFLLNAIWNKHADAMDNYPVPLFLPRRPEDREGAELLGQVVPVLLDKLGFEGVYSDLWWYKLKQGTGCYGVFWDPEREEIQVKNIELMRLYFAPGAASIQDSPYLFCLSLLPREEAQRRYGGEWPQSALTCRDYFAGKGQRELEGKVVLVDCYYKRPLPGGKTAVQLAKFSGERLLYCSEDEPAYRGRGLYDHGQYPFVLDPFIPRAGTPLGMGMAEIGRSTQSYIDRLDYLIEENALIAGRQRFLVKNGAGVDEGALADLSRNFIGCDLSVDDNAVRPLQAAPLPGFVQAHRDQKIAELKDVLGNKDFMTGGVAGGVTAYGAIVALQEAGSKLSRDLIAGSYCAFREVIGQMVWLIRQFYTGPRLFYVGGAFLTLEGARVTPHLDIKITAQKKNPFTTAAHNQLVLDLYKQGAFEAGRAEGAKACVRALALEGKEAILQALDGLGAEDAPPAPEESAEEQIAL